MTMCMTIRFRDGFTSPKDLASGETGTPVVPGSTTGPSYDPVGPAHPLQVTWSVRPWCPRSTSVPSIDVGIKGNVFNEEPSLTGVRALVDRT